jgi:hypothetical protein
MFCILGRQVLTLSDIKSDNYQIQKYDYSTFFEEYDFMNESKPYSIYIPNYGYFLPPHIEYNSNFTYCDKYVKGYYYTFNYGYTNGEQSNNLFLYFIIIIIILISVYFFINYNKKKKLTNYNEPNKLMKELYDYKLKNIDISNHYDTIENTERIFKEINSIKKCNDVLNLINTTNKIDRATNIKSYIHTLCSFDNITYEQKNKLVEYLDQIINNNC